MWFFLLLLLFIYFIIGIFERSRFAPISFLFHHHSFIFRSSSLTSDKMAKS